MGKRTAICLVGAAVLAVIVVCALLLPRTLDSKAFNSAKASADAACSKQDYELAASHYQKYLKAYPSGRYADLAHRMTDAELPRLIEAREWRRATGDDTPAAYRQYLTRFPGSHHVEEAHARLQEADAWAVAKHADTMASYGTYRARFPHGTHAAEARDRTRELQQELALAARARSTFATGRQVYLFDPSPATVSESEISGTEFAMQYVISDQGMRSDAAALMVRKVDRRGFAEDCMLFRSTGPDAGTKTGTCSFLISSTSDIDQRVIDEALGVKRRPLGKIARIEVWLVAATQTGQGYFSRSREPISNVLRIAVE